MYRLIPKKKPSKKYVNPINRYLKNLDIVSRRIKQNKSRILDSGFTEGQAWYGLGRAWLGFKISRNNADVENEEKYAMIIQRLEQDF